MGQVTAPAWPARLIRSGRPFLCPERGGRAERSGNGSDRRVNLDKLREYVALAAELGIVELTVETEEELVRFRRSTQARGSVPEQEEAEAPQAEPTLLKPVVDLTTEDIGPSTEGLELVCSEYVGFFHRGATPGSAPLVQVGTRVKPGDVVGTVEALRVLNEVTVEVAGIVKEVYVADGEAVEYQEPLMAIEPERGAEGTTR